MSLYGQRVGIICCTSSGYAESPLTCQRRDILTRAAIGDTTEDTRKIMEGTAPGRTQKDRTTGAAQDAMVEEAVTLVGDRTGQTAEAEVCEEVTEITQPSPHQDR